MEREHYGAIDGLRTIDGDCGGYRSYGVFGFDEKDDREGRRKGCGESHGKNIEKIVVKG